MRLRRSKMWLERHPWVGWYIATMVTLDFLLHLIESSHIL